MYNSGWNDKYLGIRHTQTYKHWAKIVGVVSDSTEGLASFKLSFPLPVGPRQMLEATGEKPLEKLTVSFVQ